MSAAELKAKSAEELQQELNSLLRAQFGLRMQKATQQLTNTSQLSKVRRDIARVRTVLHEKTRNPKGQGKA
jgi:large subunit ribosomal protein L29